MLCIVFIGFCFYAGFFYPPPLWLDVALAGRPVRPAPSASLTSDRSMTDHAIIHCCCVLCLYTYVSVVLIGPPAGATH